MYTDKNGNEVRIGKELGHGGEASVFAIEGNDSLVAKIYNASHSIDYKKLKKLEKMCTLFDDSIAKYYAWPQQIIYSEQNAVGFIMENINSSNNKRNFSEYIKFVNFYTWKYRRKLFPNAEYKFVVHAATNMAIAIYTLHEKDIVIGDINESNLFVNNIDTTIKLIDCDSYQIEDFLCDVGKPEYTAPELPIILRGVRRTKNNDCFALAVMIFQILVGIHPYFGGDGDTHNDNIRLSITEDLYCYGKDAESKNIYPKYPFSETYNALSKEIKNLFEQAFTSSTNRPTAKDWIDALLKYESELIPCNHDSYHFYHQSSKSCVWCEIQKNGYYAFGKSNTPLGKIQHNYNKQTLYQSSLQNIQQPQHVIANTTRQVKTSQHQIPRTNQALKYFVIIVIVIFLAIVISLNSGTSKITNNKAIRPNPQDFPNQNVETYTDSDSSNSTYYENENIEQDYVSCEADSTLKALKKIRTNELKPLLENSRYVFNSNYSLWYRNTIDQTGEGDCFTDEIIKNLFWVDQNVYLVHRINYNAHNENGNLLIDQNGYYNLNDLLNNSDFYKDNSKLSDKEINSLLERSILNNNQEKYINSSQNHKQDINKPNTKKESEQSLAHPPKTNEVFTPQTKSNQTQYKLQNTNLDDQVTLPTETNTIKPVGNENEFFE